MEFFILAIVAVSSLIGIFGAVALTEIGQLLKMPKSWVFAFFNYKKLLSALIVLAVITVLLLDKEAQFFSYGLKGLYVLAIIACVFFINFFAPDFWLRSQQSGAEFTSIQDADKRLEDATDVFVLEIDGDARAYPRDWMQLPHIVGDKVGEQSTVMTYCALSNLPLAFNPAIDGKETNFKVIAQVDNNLIFSDRNSGELIQQVTATTEYSQTELHQYPVQRMPWKSFKALYPDGRVFDYKANWYDKLTLKLFNKAMPSHYEGKPMFPTLDLKDQRLENGTQIWGVKVEDETVAVSKESFLNNNIRFAELHNKRIAFVYFPEFETVGAFDVIDEINDLDNLSIDVYGNTEFGKLNRVNLYSGMPWMIWSHWFPNSQIIA